MVDDNKTTRRKVLKTSGAAFAGIAGLSTSSVASSGDKTRHHLAVADRIYKKTGDIEARTEYLRNHDIPTGHEEVIFSSDHMSDGVSAETVDCVEPDKCDGDIGVTLSISFLSTYGHYYVSSSVKIRYETDDWGGLNSGGEEPHDGLGIQWGNDRWEVVNSSDLPSCTYGDDHIEWDNGSWNKEGLAFRVDDYWLCYDSGGTFFEEEWSDIETAGVDLNLGDDWESDDSVTASYRHTWNDTTADLGFGVSFPWGISISSGMTSSVKSEDFQTNLDGKTLEVFESDAW